MWNPPIALTPEEHKIAARTRKARKFDTVRKTAKVVDSWFGQATRMVDVKHVDAFQGLFMACISGLEACLRPLCPSVGSRNH